MLSVTNRLGWLNRHAWFVAIAITYLYAFPYYPRIQSANELPRIYLVKAIADDHTFVIDRGVARWGATADVSPSDGHQYSNKAPGSSMLAAAPYWIASTLAGEPSLAATMGIARVFAGIVPALLFLLLLYRFLARWVPEPEIRQLVCLAYGLGSLAMTYSILFYSHQLAAACIGSAWIFGLDAAERRRGVAAFVAAGALAGCAALVDYQAVFAVVPIAAHVIVAFVAQRWPLPRALLGAGLAIAGFAIPVAILLAYHADCFGSPFRTGYDASTTFAFHHQRGFLGMDELRWEAFVGSFVKLDNGLVVLAPWLLAALPGIVVLAAARRPRRDITTACVTFGVIVVYTLFISAINFWRGGWGVGPRYITAMLPFLLPAIAVAFSELAKLHKLAVGAAAGTIVVGVVVYTATSVTFPYWPDSVENPLYEITFRLLADGIVAPNVASALGLGGIAGVLPVLLIVAAVVGRAIQRVAGWTGLAVAVAVALAILVVYGCWQGSSERQYHFVVDAILR